MEGYNFLVYSFFFGNLLFSVHTYMHTYMHTHAHKHTYNGTHHTVLSVQNAYDRASTPCTLR
eukprot:NODE_8166_length_226_cov_5.152542_g8083_i0.p4 GENE.NODE_8166_length_226_cov_5.152542_g8083_i0~~NODE_8166_length_226_cov_5.152542_g8083_i0.p4  ORF type:complete len:62 (-),score=18.91 NODE_8166_length_226_cov_5.152542_g8083_i0:5-190(-)